MFSWCDTETFVMLTVSVMNVQINFQTSKVVQNDLQKHTCFKFSLSIFISSARWMRPPVNTQPIGTAHFTQITENSAVSLLLQVPVTVLTQDQQEETHQRQHQQKDSWKFTSYCSVIQVPFAGVLYICTYMSLAWFYLNRNTEIVFADRSLSQSEKSTLAGKLCVHKESWMSGTTTGAKGELKYKMSTFWLCTDWSYLFKFVGDHSKSLEDGVRWSGDGNNPLWTVALRNIDSRSTLEDQQLLFIFSGGDKKP